MNGCLVGVCLVCGLVMCAGCLYSFSHALESDGVGEAHDVLWDDGLD